MKLALSALPFVACVAVILAGAVVDSCEPRHHVDLPGERTARGLRQQIDAMARQAVSP